MSALDFRESAVLRSLAVTGGVEIPNMSEPYRQATIALGMRETPLVDVEVETVRLTPAGWRELAALGVAAAHRRRR